MKMRKKILTTNCVSCNLMNIDDDNNCICRWGKGKPKVLEPNKGKKPVQCKLKRN